MNRASRTVLRQSKKWYSFSRVISSFYDKKICLIVFVARRPRYCGITHGHIADGCQRNNLIGLSPTAGYSGIRAFGYGSIIIPNTCHGRLLSAAHESKSWRANAVRLCGSRSRAVSVTYLLYRYSVVKYQRENLSSHLIGQKSAQSQPCHEKKLKIFFWSKNVECFN